MMKNNVCRLVTVFEAAQKDKKQKEDKSTPIGQAILDLWPLLKGSPILYSLKCNQWDFFVGETQVSITAPIYPIPGSFLETQTDPNQVEENTFPLSVTFSMFLAIADHHC